MDNSLQRGTDNKGLRDVMRTGGQNLQGTKGAQRQEKNSEQVAPFLDLFSTSQTKQNKLPKNGRKTDRQIYDECVNNAPYFGYQIEGKRWGVVQGCCNDWNCPRCGQQRAREEYGRIVVGARELGQANKLYMLTITCRGKEMSYEDAENGYLVWTNRLLTRLRTEAKRNSDTWAYASVTERQTRKHPHSHYLTTYSPTDGIPIAKGEGKSYCTTGMVFPAKHDCIQSFRLEKACVECGLGWQYDFSELQSVEGASRYVAKYLFKASIFEEIWPKGWRRVRYSQNWPKLPEIKTDAMLLLTNDDWNNLARKALIIKTNDDGAKKEVKRRLSLADVIIQ